MTALHPLDLEKTKRVSAFDQALAAETPADRHQASANVKEALAVIDKHLARKVPMRRSLMLFNKQYGTSYELPRFRQLVRDARPKPVKQEDDTSSTDGGAA